MTVGASACALVTCVRHVMHVFAHICIYAPGGWTSSRRWQEAMQASIQGDHVAQGADMAGVYSGV